MLSSWLDDNILHFDRSDYQAGKILDVSSNWMTPLMLSSGWTITVYCCVVESLNGLSVFAFSISRKLSPFSSIFMSKFLWKENKNFREKAENEHFRFNPTPEIFFKVGFRSSQCSSEKSVIQQRRIEPASFQSFGQIKKLMAPQG